MSCCISDAFHYIVRVSHHLRLISHDSTLYSVREPVRDFRHLRLGSHDNTPFGKQDTVRVFRRLGRVSCGSIPFGKPVAFMDHYNPYVYPYGFMQSAYLVVPHRSTIHARGCSRVPHPGFEE
jgi:hypothetical protein